MKECLDAWMHWLTKYTKKKCHVHSDIHSITCMATLFNNHPYISSSKYYGCWIMWPCYRVHITVCMALPCVLSQPVHSCIGTSLHQLDFFLEIFYGDLFLFFFDKISFFQLLCGATHILIIDVSSSHVCTNEWHPTASTLCPLSLPNKKV